MNIFWLKASLTKENGEKVKINETILSGEYILSLKEEIKMPDKDLETELFLAEGRKLKRPSSKYEKNLNKTLGDFPKIGDAVEYRQGFSEIVHWKGVVLSIVETEEYLKDKKKMVRRTFKIEIS